MKCPKCGYHSFDHLDSCKKCGKGFAEHKEKFNLRGFFFPGHKAVVEAESAVDESYGREEPSDDKTVAFGFDFLDDDESPAEKPTGSISLGHENLAFNIDQPFGADSETIPADDRHIGSDDKPGKGPEFAF